MLKTALGIYFLPDRVCHRTSWKRSRASVPESRDSIKDVGPTKRAFAARTTKPRAAALHLARLENKSRGVVIDYSTLSGTVTSYTFASGQTYYLTSGFSVGNGVTTFQPGSVLKYALNAYLLCSGGIFCPAGGTLMPVLTSKDENLFGETISGSTGTPNTAAAQAIVIYYFNQSLTLENLRIRYATQGIQINTSAGAPLYTIKNSMLQKLPHRHFQEQQFHLAHQCDEMQCDDRCGQYRHRHHDRQHDAGLRAVLHGGELCRAKK